MKKLTLLVVFIACLSIQNIYAQLETGSIKMEVTDFSMPGMEDGVMTQMEPMMKSMAMTIHFKPGTQVTEINMMGMMNMSMHYAGDEIIQYMDMMGQKMMIKTPVGAQGLEALGLSAEEVSKAYQISYDKSATRTISGYECYEATITMDTELFTQDQEIPAEMANMKMTMYVTDEIKMDQFALQQLPGLQLDGTPLEMVMDMGMMKMTYTATEISKDIDMAVFDKPEGDYKEMSLEELQQLGMNPGSFGF